MIFSVAQSLIFWEKGEKEEEKKRISFAEEEKFPYCHNSELVIVMYSVITHVLSNNVKVNSKAVYSKEVFSSRIP